MKIEKMNTSHYLSQGTLFLLFLFTSCTQGQEAAKKCQGFCTTDFPGCRAKGGKIYSYCSPAGTGNGCCEVAGSCGQSMNAKIVFFKSPSYPEVVGGDLTCEFKAEIAEDTVGLRVDFIDTLMDGQSYLQSPNEDGQCDSDMIYLKGFNWWTPPPRCGNMRGYSTIIDVQAEKKLGPMKTLSIIAMMSSPSYRWHMKVTQISKTQLQVRREELKEAESLLNLETVALPPIGSENFGVSSQGTDSITITSKKADNSGSANAGNSNSSPAENSGNTESDDSQETTTESSDEDEDDDNRKRKINLLHREARRVKSKSSIKGRAGEANSTAAQNTLDIKESDVRPPVVPLTQFPWKASFRINYRPVAGEKLGNGVVGVCKSKEGTHYCSGSVIGDRYILSASHCFFGSSKTEGMIDLNEVQVLLGDDSNICNGSESTAAGKVYKIDRVTYHYGYDQNLILNDLVLVRLQTPIRTFRNSFYPFVRLAAKDENYVGKKALVNFVPKEDRNSLIAKQNVEAEEESQQGTPSSDQDKQNSKPKLEFTIQNQTFCNGLVSEYYSAPKDKVINHPKYRSAFKSTLCVVTKDSSRTPESEAVSSGMGDSGGPLILQDTTGKPVLVGVVSYGVSPEGENANYYKIVDYFTSVSHYRRWIEISMVE